MPKRDRAMSVEECAARMQRFLSTRPRSGKTRAYLDTLPNRQRKLEVTAAEYRALTGKSAATMRFKRAKVIVNQILQNLALEAAGAPRKDRLRPRVAARRPAEKYQRWKCRPHGWRHRDGKRLQDYTFRDLEQCAEWREKLWSAQQGVCGLCGKPMKGPAKAESLDHVIPRFDGGVDALGNLLLCHGECNGAKTNDVPTGCELVALLAVNARLGVAPLTW